MANLKNTVINSTDAIQLPSGTTSERPISPSDGYMRFNTDMGVVEYYVNNGWSFLPDIVKDGLVLYLDAGNPDSYPGTGSTWFDLSGNSHHYSIGSNITWNSNGFFDVAGGTFTGPPSNSFGFSSENSHTVQAFVKVNQTVNNGFFHWKATPNTGTDTRAIFTHLHYGNGNTYYDVSGCCGSTQRISYPNDEDLKNGVNQLTWITRTNSFPQRQILKNLKTQVDSGSNTTATVTWNLNDAAIIGDGWQGNLHYFLAYNRALSDKELIQNFNALRKRFNL